MILVLDARRPACLSLEINFQLEAYLEHSQNLAEKCSVLGRSGAIEIPTGLIVPSNSEGKVVQVACRGRPITSADVSSIRLVDTQNNVYGDGFGWKFLVDATLTAIRIGDETSMRIVVITTDLMLTCENLEGESGRFFSIVSQTLGAQASASARISLVFVEVSGSCTSGDTLSSPDSFDTWAKLEQLRDSTKEGAYALDLIGNTPAMFDSQLRSWLRESSPRQACALRLPATETFSGVVVEVEITPYLLHQRGLMHDGPVPALHEGFTTAEVLQGVDLGSLDQGLCRGDPLLCVPPRLHGSPQQSEANRKLFIAVCAELNENDMGLLLAVRQPSSSLQERWLLLPQAPVAGCQELSLSDEPRSCYEQPGVFFVDRALLVRLATKEDVLDEGPAAGLSGAKNVECSVERAAACASLGMLKKGAYNPLGHSSQLFEHLASFHRARSHGNAAFASSRGFGRHPLSTADQQVTGPQNLAQRQQRSSLPSWPFPRMNIGAAGPNGVPPGTGNGKPHRSSEKREINLRYPGSSAVRRNMSSEGKGRKSPQAGRSRVPSKKNKRSSAFSFGEVTTGEQSHQDSGKIVHDHDENMML
ncbi:unnamed protein product [Ascophyllum nodosum]